VCESLEIIREELPNDRRWPVRAKSGSCRNCLLATPRPSFSQSWRRKRVLGVVSRHEGSWEHPACVRGLLGSVKVARVPTEWSVLIFQCTNRSLFRAMSCRFRRQCFGDLQQHSTALCSTLLSSRDFLLPCFLSRQSRRHVAT
jgi:hypothetical protein